MKRNVFLLVLAVCLALTSLEMKAQNVSVWDGTMAAWTHGNGTQANPYLIENAQQLAWLAEMVSGGVSTYANMHFKLTTDINLRSLSWTPIGSSETNCFKGTFDGDNHFIDSITVTTGENRGLFGVVGAGATVKNVEVKVLMNFSYSAEVHVGGIVAMSIDSNTTINNCHTKGVINTTGTGARFIGGILGYGNGSNIENCSNSCTITANSNNTTTAGVCVGGVIGCYIGKGSMYQCWNDGNITGKGMTGGGPFCGGGIGMIKRIYPDITQVNIDNFQNSGNVHVVMQYGDNNYAGRACSGGVVGYRANNAGICEINHCCNLGDITTGTTTFHSNDMYIAQGIAYSGKISNCRNSGLVQARNSTSGIGGDTTVNCYNTGTVSTNNVSNAVARGIGGATVINSYNVGTLSAPNKYGITVLTNSTPTVINSYYLETCGGTGAGTPKTEAAMKAASFPMILNADSVVFTMDVLNVNQGYPIFANEIYVLTDTVESVSFTSATIKGLYSGTASVKGFEYKKSTDNNYTTVYCSANQPYAYQLSGLQSGTNYQYRYFVQQNGITHYGQVKNFTTLSCDVQVTIYTPAGMHCAGDDFVLTASATSQYANQFTYLWSNGVNGNTMSPSESGVYSVTATASNGCTQSSSVSVTMYPSPVGVITGDTLLCAGGTVTLTASGANTYHWSTGSTNAVLTVGNPGTYSCTFTNQYGCTSTRNIQVAAFTAFISGTPHICSGQSTVLTASPADSYLWSTGAQTNSITASSTGSYTVTAYHGSCSATATVSVTAAALPTPVISGSTQFCEGQSGTLTANGGVSYLWSTGATQPSIAVTQGGTYTVTVTNAEGCSASTQTMVTLIPAPAITISGNTNLCEGESTTLMAAGADNYLWSTGSNAASIQVSSFGIYNVTGTSSNGCVGYGSVMVFVSSNPTVIISGNTDICQGETAVLTATGASSYIWSNGSENAVLSTSNAGSYSVIGFDDNGCMGNASVTVSVWQPAASEFTINTNQSSYTWNETTYTQSGDYTQTLQTVHGCDSVVTLHLTITVGVSEYGYGETFVLYPNPTRNQLYVQCSRNEEETDMHIQLMDIYGKRLLTLPVVDETTQIDMSSLSDGVYFVQLVRNNVPVAVGKVVKTR